MQTSTPSFQFRERPAGQDSRGRGPRRGSGDGRGGLRKLTKRRPCRITAERKGPLDYKETEFLSKFVSERNKIMPRSVTGACAKKQRDLARAVKRARALGLLKHSKVI